MVLAMMLDMRTRHSESVDAIRQLELEMAATEAIELVMQRMADDAERDVDHTNELWYTSFKLMYPSGIETYVWVEDESGKFDLNNLSLMNRTPSSRPPDDVLIELMMACGDYHGGLRATAVRDWVDEDEEGPRESSFYMAMENPYRAANTLLHHVSELSRVDGFSEDYLQREELYEMKQLREHDFVDCVTALPEIRSRLLPVNINTAPREVLLGILGLPLDQTVNKILFLRSMKPLQSLDVVSSLLGDDLFASVRRYLDVKSRYARIHCKASRNGSIVVTALVSRDAEGVVRPLQWTQMVD